MLRALGDAMRNVERSSCAPRSLERAGMEGLAQNAAAVVALRLHSDAVRRVNAGNPVQQPEIELFARIGGLPLCDSVLN